MVAGVPARESALVASPVSHVIAVSYRNAVLIRVISPKDYQSLLVEEKLAAGWKRIVMTIFATAVIAGATIVTILYPNVQLLIISFQTFVGNNYCCGIRKIIAVSFWNGDRNYRDRIDFGSSIIQIFNTEPLLMLI